jgi:16S rRNA (guanine527-N7)-methyltransferase
MDEAEARNWIESRLDVSRETLGRLQSFAQCVIDENERQNLISRATIAHIWTRHILDSAQLLLLAEGRDRSEPWLDLGTGAGFPGMIIAMLTNQPVILVEERRRRAQFLTEQVERLGLDHVIVVPTRLESLESRPVSVISARAFAPLPKLLRLAHRFAHQKTLWLLPKGRSAREELESARASWQGVFTMKPSQTDPDAAILVAQGVSPKKGTR